MKTVPTHYTETDDTFCSNFDHEIDFAIAEQMKTEDVFGGYPAANFYGKVWFDKSTETYCCEIHHYGSHAETFESETPHGLKELCCNKYGNA